MRLLEYLLFQPIQKLRLLIGRHCDKRNHTIRSVNQCRARIHSGDAGGSQHRDRLLRPASDVMKFPIDFK